MAEVRNEAINEVRKEYIERNALIAEYDRIHIGPAGGARKLMVDAPAADVVEVRHGEWIKKYPQYANDGIYYCSKCRDDLDIATGKETPIDRGFYYCPNCGADMRGERKENG